MSHPICIACSKRAGSFTHSLPGDGICAFCGSDGCRLAIDDITYSVLLNNDELVNAYESTLRIMEDMTDQGSDGRASFKRLLDTLNLELERRGLPF